MSRSSWETAAVCSDELSAQALLGRFAAEGVPARLEADSALLGASRSCRILVPARLLHRARWVLSQSSFTAEELEALATASSGEP